MEAVDDAPAPQPLDASPPPAAPADGEDGELTTAGAAAADGAVFSVGPGGPKETPTFSSGPKETPTFASGGYSFSHSLLLSSTLEAGCRGGAS